VGELQVARRQHLRTLAIITTNANATMRSIHDRMPVVLEPADSPLWLGEEEGDDARLLRPADDGILQLWHVSTRVNAPKNNGPTLLDRAIEEADGGGPNPAQTGRRSDST
jgi:putative SOS response-associated peptidase YedK